MNVLAKITPARPSVRFEDALRQLALDIKEWETRASRCSNSADHWRESLPERAAIAKDMAHSFERCLQAALDAAADCYGDSADDISRLVPEMIDDALASLTWRLGEDE